ncbi:MAG: DUF6088 family protein [Planctomycetota bacterium]
MSRTDAPPATAPKVLDRLRARGRGFVFVPADLFDLGSRPAVDQALHRLVVQGAIRRLCRGIYDFPRTHPRFGALAPSLPDVAQASARSTRSSLLVSGAAAANHLGLSTQVPAQLVYLTDGPSRMLRVGTQTIVFRHASPRRMAGAGSTAGAVIQTLRHLGRDGIGDDVVAALRRQLAAKDRRDLRRLVSDGPAWMHSILRRITEEPGQAAA